jgi:hypothetical protein
MTEPAEVRSVTEFQRNIKEYVGRLKANKSPIVLTVDGHAELVVQDAASYGEILARLERAEAIAGIREGIAQADCGEGIPLELVEDRLRTKHGFSRRG